MTKDDCYRYEDCSAPICPMDAESLKYCSWFPDEDICKKQPLPGWVKKQRKLSRKMNFENGCFTYKMLNHGCKFYPGTKGINPDKGPAHEQEEGWIKDHPKYTPSKKQIEASKKSPVAMGKAG